MVNISKNIVYELDGNDFTSVKVLSFDDLTEAALTKILHELIVACNVIPFRGKNEIALLLTTLLLFHYIIIICLEKLD